MPRRTRPKKNAKRRPQSKKAQRVKSEPHVSPCGIRRTGWTQTSSERVCPRRSILCSKTPLELKAMLKQPCNPDKRVREALALEPYLR